MWFELHPLVWVGVGWLLCSVCLALALGRWFRYLREEDTDWHG